MREREVVVRNMRVAVADAGGNIKRAATAVGVSYKTFYNRIHRWGELADIRANIGRTGTEAAAQKEVVS